MKAIDLFAGWGGMTLGAKLAGTQVVWAANHWPLAVETHALNHPGTAHACQDLRQADWTALPAFDLLLAAPACQGHSRASQPKRRAYHDALRATAWAVVDCAEATQPRALVVENVTSFREWRLYRTWLSALRKLGYTLTEQILDASRHGVPQLRRRVFVVGTRRRRPVLVPPSTPIAPAFGEHIEWDAPGWRPVTAMTEGAQRRVAAARAKGLKRFLIQHVTGHAGVPLEEPIRTITTKDQWAVVDGDQARPLTLREYARGMSFPDSYRWSEGLARNVVTLGLGNAVPPLLARDVIAAVSEAA